MVIRIVLATELYVRETLDVCTPLFLIFLSNEPMLIGSLHADAEALQISFDPAQVTYRTLLEYFYKMHDPTTSNRQGPDAGSQYRSGIFYHSPEQESVAREVTKLVNEKWWKGNVVTEILPAGQWWDAEDYHQKYLDKNAGGYECPSHFLRKFPAL